MKVLIADKDPSLCFFLREVVENCGHSPLVASDGACALETFENEQPEVVLSALAVPGMRNLELLEEVRRRNPETVFVVLAEEGSAQQAAHALELKASNYLLKPVRFEALTTLLNKYADIVQTRTMRHEIHRMVTRREVAIRLENRTEMVSEVCDYLLEQAAGAIPGEWLFGLHLGLYELIMNAIEHGNLGITFEGKRRALEIGTQNYFNLVARRTKEPEGRSRRVNVEFRLDSQRCAWTIEDEGAGFDWNDLPNPFLPGQLEGVNGRGIFLARFHFDELTFLESGNRVRAVKHLPKR